MKHLKVFEKFNNISSICRKFGIEDWIQNSDGTIDVDGDVDIAYKGLSEIPLKFGKVTGNFYCFSNALTTLEGAPIEIGDDFRCDDNCLVNLKGAPSEVGGDFNCSFNQLITLESAPSEVGGLFDCSNNRIWNIYKLFPDYKSFMSSMDWEYLSGTSIIKFKFKEALDEINKQMPKSIPGYKWI